MAKGHKESAFPAVYCKIFGQCFALPGNRDYNHGYAQNTWIYGTFFPADLFQAFPGAAVHFIYRFNDDGGSSRFFPPIHTFGTVSAAG